MRPDPVTHPARAAIRARRLFVIIVLSMSFAANCGSSQPKTEVLGVVEPGGASIDVELIEALCITNTPTHEPC